jgi:hypothetical protein
MKSGEYRFIVSTWDAPERGTIIRHESGMEKSELFHPQKNFADQRITNQAVPFSKAFLS